MSKKRRKPLFVRVQKMAVGDLLCKSDIALEKFEKRLREEARQANLSHHWMQGVIRLKRALEGKQ